jgi:hypothetical protein
MVKEAKQQPVSQFLTIRLSGLLGAATVLLLLAYSVFSIYEIFNPSGMNHLVFIDCRSDSPEPMLNILMRGDAEWTERGSNFGLHRGPNSIVAMNISYPWLNGDIIIRGEDNMTIAELTISPPGRYSGSLVVVKDKNGDVNSAWGRMPDGLTIEKMTQVE